MSLFTLAAQDAMEYLMQTSGGGAQDSEYRVLRAALHHSYRDVCGAKDWLWHVDEGSITTIAGENTYPLPVNCKNVDAISLPDQTTTTSYVTPAEWVRLEQNDLTLGFPVYWTVSRSTDPSSYDRWVLKIAGRLPAGTVLRYTYRRQVNPLSLMGYESYCRTGNVTVAGTKVIGTNVNFPLRVEGAIFRVGTPANVPESLAGFYPYISQSKIAKRDSATELTLEDDLGTFPTSKYTVSCHLDMSQQMYSALLSGTEVYLARLMGKNIDGAISLYQRDLKMAMEGDVLAPLSGRRGPYERQPDLPSAPYAGSYTMGPDGGTN
jgi:hypothetical protein